MAPDLLGENRCVLLAATALGDGWCVLLPETPGPKGSVLHSKRKHRHSAIPPLDPAGSCFSTARGGQPLGPPLGQNGLVGSLCPGARRAAAANGGGVDGVKTDGFTDGFGASCIYIFMYRI